MKKQLGLLIILFILLFNSLTTTAQVSQLNKPFISNENQQVNTKLNSFLDSLIQSEQTRYNQIKDDTPINNSGVTYDDPNWSLCLLNGRKLEKQGQYKQAVEQYKKSLTYKIWGGNNYYAYLDLGRVYYRMEQFDDAKKALNTFIAEAQFAMNPGGGDSVPPAYQQIISTQINEANYLLNLINSKQSSIINHNNDNYDYNSPQPLNNMHNYQDFSNNNKTLAPLNPPIIPLVSGNSSQTKTNSSYIPPPVVSSMPQTNWTVEEARQEVFKNTPKYKDLSQFTSYDPNYSDNIYALNKRNRQILPTC